MGSVGTFHLSCLPLAAKVGDRPHQQPLRQLWPGSERPSLVDLVDFTQRIEVHSELKLDTLEVLASVVSALPQPTTPPDAETLERAYASFVLLKKVVHQSLNIGNEGHSTTLREELSSVLAIRWDLVCSWSVALVSTGEGSHRHLVIDIFKNLSNVSTLLYTHVFHRYSGIAVALSTLFIPPKEPDDILLTLSTLKHLTQYLQDKATVHMISRNLRLWNRGKRKTPCDPDWFARSLLNRVSYSPSSLQSEAICIRNYLESFILMTHIVVPLREDGWLWCSVARVELPRAILSGLVDLLRLTEGCVDSETLTQILDGAQRVMSTCLQPRPPASHHLKTIASVVGSYLELILKALPNVRWYPSQGQLLAQMSFLGPMAAHSDIKLAMSNFYESTPLSFVESLSAMTSTARRVWKDLHSFIIHTEQHENTAMGGIHQSQMCDNPIHHSQPTMEYKICSHCKAVGYCSTFCQAEDWRNNHRDSCSQLKDVPTNLGVSLSSKRRIHLLRHFEAKYLRWRNDIDPADLSSPPTSQPGGVVLIDSRTMLGPYLTMTQAVSLERLIYLDSDIPVAVQQRARQLIEGVSTRKHLVHGIATWGTDTYIHALILIQTDGTVAGEIVGSSITSLTFSEHINRVL
ncbi:hypothetical protein BKA70DRAFT_1450079 [Coprinopsis sp. MPI-PUGE-AT-0042]|nr:hypothetical protein BKA70DRAFT_1450079 [Coprinopsis sp. MPI-PUGE-AT-0042]